jgi:hypothetical protein
MAAKPRMLRKFPPCFQPASGANPFSLSARPIFCDIVCRENVNAAVPVRMSSAKADANPVAEIVVPLADLEVVGIAFRRRHEEGLSNEVAHAHCSISSAFWIGLLAKSGGFRQTSIWVQACARARGVGSSP